MIVMISQITIRGMNIFRATVLKKYYLVFFSFLSIRNILKQSITTYSKIIARPPYKK